MKRFVLRVRYGTGTLNVLTDKPDLISALEEFREEYKKSLPDTKMYGLPDIIEGELLPLAYYREN
jgi:hypothetical protein